MAEEPPDRKKSGLYPGDGIEQAHRLQVVEVGHTCAVCIKYGIISINFSVRWCG